MSKLNACFLSNKEDWATPQWLFDELNHEFRFTIDAAASRDNAKCNRYFTKQTDGLSNVWSGTVWCNPPYGKGIIDWVKKAYESQKDGVTTVMLLPARTDTKWFHEYVLGKAEVRFLRGRIRFEGSSYNAPFPSILVIFRGSSNNTKENPCVICGSRTMKGVN